ncbi:MAG: methylmalonyl-CoA mutase family protein, partial [bacterium]
MKPDLAAWRALVERDLKGAPTERLVRQTDDGVAIQPLYTEAQGTLAAARAMAATPLRLSAPPPGDPASLAAWLTDDLARGAEGAVLPAASLPDLAALDQVLAVVPAGTPVNLDGSGLALAHGLLARRRGTPGGLGLSPFERYAAEGRPPGGLLHQGARLAVEAPGWRVFEVDGHRWHAAGAADAQELALALAGGLGCLRALDAAGAGPTAIGFTVAVGTRFFESIAKLRALRACWFRILEASGLAPDLRLRARPAARQWTREEPFVNLLRGTAMTFAAYVGGADEVVGVPFDLEIGASAAGRRLARNTAQILADEGHLGRVADPAGGSFFLETLTAELAERAWAGLQAIEAAGGLRAALAAGTVQAEIATVAARRAVRIARRQQGIVGVSEYPVPGPAATAARTPTPPPAQADAVGEPVAALLAGAPCAAVDAALDPEEAEAALRRLVPVRDAFAFEELRASAAGAVCLVRLGPLARHLPRV